jgi:hypothetical protein
MSTTSLAKKRNETFDTVEETRPVATSVVHKVASDEEAEAAFSYAISKHKKALEELAKYDRS